MFLWVFKCFVVVLFYCCYVPAWGFLGFYVSPRRRGAWRVSTCFCVSAIRRISTRRFLNWISALRSLIGERIELIYRCKAAFTRRFINAVLNKQLKAEGGLWKTARRRRASRRGEAPTCGHEELVEAFPKPRPGFSGPSSEVSRTASALCLSCCPSRTIQTVGAC